jgi:predicted DNA-binding protein
LLIRLSPQIEARLRRAAKQSGQSTTHLAVNAILRFLDDREDMQIATSRYAAVVEGKTKTYALEDMEREFQGKR